MDPTTNAPGELTATVELPASDSSYALGDFSLTIIDVAGNPTTMPLSDYYTNNPNQARVEAIVVDIVDPTASLSFDNTSPQNGFYYNANRTATITVTEAHLGAIAQCFPSRAIAIITSSNGNSTINITAGQFSNPSGDGITWLYNHTFSVDNDYTLTIDFVDVVNHPLASGALSESFVIDKTAPVLLVTFDNENAHSPFYYNAPRTATIQVAETNFSADLVSVASTASDANGVGQAAPGISGWSPEGTSSHKTTVYYGSELHYTLTANATDLAGNVAEAFTVPEFVIDMTLPTITIENVEDTQAIAGTVAPKVTFFDLNLEDYAARVNISRASGEVAYRFSSEEQLTTTTKILSYEDLESTLENDDVYILTATITDKAGNEVEQTLTFSVNRFGSTYIFSPKTQRMSGNFLAQAQEVVVTEINVSGLKEQESLVRISANGGVKTLDPTSDYTTETTLDEALWTSTTYTIPASQFDEDGFYRVLFRSIDLADNLSENTMDNKNETRDATAELAFALDTTAPLGSIYNVDDNGIYNEAEIAAQIRVTDNLAYDYARIVIDGVEVARYTANGNETTRTEDLVIPEADHAQHIVLEIVDRAGNTTTIEKIQVFVSSDLITLITNTPLARWLGISPLVGLAFGLLLVALAAALFFLIAFPLMRKRRKKAEEEKLAFSTATSSGEFVESSERFKNIDPKDSR